MNEDLKMLLEKRDNARGYYEALGMRNTHGLTSEQQIELDIAYGQARIAWMEAEQAYRAAIANRVHETCVENKDAIYH